MKRAILVLLGIIGFMTLVGCQWFADNPMFPTAKIAVEARIIDVNGDEVLSGALGYTTKGKEEVVSRSAKFSFRPLNRVGAEIRQCKIEYFTLDGKSIPNLESSFDLFISVVPPDTPMASVYAGTQNVALAPYQLTLELFSVRVEKYMQQSRVPVLKVRVTFSGVDYAGHNVSFVKEFPIKAFEGINEGLVSNIAYSCLGDKLVFEVLIAENVEWIEKVEFYLNGESVGWATSPPFVSNPVSLGECFPVNLSVVVTDVLGNTVVKNQRLDRNPCTCL